MAKDPAFLFYSSDFLSGVQDLNFEERGQYITLLCLQHQKGHLSDKVISLSVVNLSPDVRSKFRQDEQGLWYNERLEKEVEKRKNYYDSQAKKAQKKWEKTRKNDAPVVAVADAAAYAVGYTGGMPGHMPTENDNTVFKKGVTGGNENPEIRVSLEECKRIALLDTRWISKNKTNPGLLDAFNDFLERGGCYEKTPIDYKTHYRNWNAKKPEQAPVKPITNKLDELKKRYSDPA